jgi:two-component system chemotaxis response regulator CheB
LSVVLSGLGADFMVPVLVVQHLAAGFTAGLCTWLDRVCPLRVREAVHGSELEPGTVYVAPQDRHLLVDDARRIRLDDGPPVAGHRASGTLLLGSLARVDGMPGAARRLGAARWVAPLSDIASTVTDVTRGSAR